MSIFLCECVGQRLHRVIFLLSFPNPFRLCPPPLLLTTRHNTTATLLGRLRQDPLG